MAYEANLTIIGNCTAAPELKKTASGKSVANFSVAVNKSRKVGDQWEKEPNYFDVTVWDELADNVAAQVQKGSRVIVYGDIHQQKWETSDGQTRSKLKITATDVGVSMRWGVKRQTQPPAPAYSANEEPF